MGKNKSSKISGISVGLGFIALGVIFAYWLKDTYGTGTKYVAAALILLGVVAFMVELQKNLNLTGRKLRADSGGVGILLSVVGAWLAGVVYQHMHGFWRGMVVTLLASAILIGAIGIMDFVVSIFEDFVKDAADFRDKAIGFTKLIVLLASSTAAIITALKQVL